MTSSFDYTKRSPLHRMQARNRRLKKFIALFLILGGACVLLTLLWLGLLPTRPLVDRPLHLRITAGYGAAGTLFLLLAGLLAQVRHRVMFGLDPGRQERRRRTRRRQRELRRRNHAARRGGAVLILVLLLTALLSALVLQAQSAARRRLALRQATLDELRLRAAAADAVRAAMQRLADDETLEFDTLDEDWAQPSEETDPTGIEVRVIIEDEDRYFDANNLRNPHLPGTPFRDPREVLLDLLNQCGIFAAMAKAENLRDWIDEDDVGLRERAFYLAQEPPYAAPDRWICAWSEVLLIDEFDRSLFDRRLRSSLTEPFAANLIDTITFLPVERTSVLPINVNTAALETLMGVFGVGNEPKAEFLFNARKLTPIRSLEALQAFAPDDLLEQVGPYLDVRSQFFRIRADASLPGHTEQLRVLVQREAEGMVKVLQWVF